MIRWLRMLRAASLLLLGACASAPAPHRALQETAEPAQRACAIWFAELDARIDAAGLRDREARRIDGFPYLRVSRLLAALQPQLPDTAAARDWLAALREEDRAARRAELANLAPQGGAAQAQQRSEECAHLLMAADAADPRAWKDLGEAAVVPDAYRDILRVLGVYPLSRVFFAQGIARWHRETLDGFGRPAAGGLPLLSLAPAPGEGYRRGEVAALLRERRDALGIPRLAPEEALRLARSYAPVFDIEQGGEYDRPGAPAWQADGRIATDTVPTVYWRLVHTLYAGQVLTQLVYTLWFPERPARGAFDILAGTLDGLVWRVTLAPDGEPVLHDSMHPCGCYHMFFPAPRAALKDLPAGNDEWAFVPAAAPALAEGQRLRLRVQSATHYLTGIAVDDGARGGGSVYTLRDEHELRALPLPQGGSRSLYGPDALVAGTQRAERFLFWPMGIPSAGAMRQWGHHATAFLGRRHFDDADLIERRFTLRLQDREHLTE